MTDLQILIRARHRLLVAQVVVGLVFLVALFGGGFGLLFIVVAAAVAGFTEARARQVVEDAEAVELFNREIRGDS